MPKHKLAQLEQFYQAREDVYDRVGYKEAERVVQMLFDRAFDIKEQILVVPAHTFEGVLVKLNVARDGTDEDGENFWEQMFRSAHDDMQRVASR